MTKSRTYHDPLHGAIVLAGSDPVERLLMALIDTPEFQRLRRIRQLDTAFFTFHGAEGSRFTHSLGVMHLTRRAFQQWVQLYPMLEPHRAAVLAAALLHDVGHGPFSHAGEEVFGSRHEVWTLRLLRESSLHSLLTAFDPGLPKAIAAILTKNYPVPALSQLVSSQLDCDRLDYLQRDSYYTGARYGQLDLDRILLALQFDPVSQQLVVSPKGLTAIEHYLMVRYFMYVQVYNHPKNLAARFTLDRIMARVRELVQGGVSLFLDETARAWLLTEPEGLSWQQYLAGDDTVFNYHLGRWQTAADPVLRDLCRRYQDRDLFKAVDITGREEAAVRTHLSQRLPAGYPPAYYVGIRRSLTKGYTLYAQGIALQTTAGLREISEISPVVQAIAQPRPRIWAIAPKSVVATLHLEAPNAPFPPWELIL